MKHGALDLYRIITVVMIITIIILTHGGPNFFLYHVEKIITIEDIPQALVSIDKV
jgi:hypothetical protein